MPRMIASVIFSVLGWSFTVATAQLPPEIMMDRYLVQAERLMDEKNYKAAREAMEKIVALKKEHDLTLPDEFYFKYARLLLSAGSVKAAIDAVSRYLVAEGRSGDLYGQALELLDEAEKKLPANVAYRFLVQVERLIADKNYKAATDMVNKLIDLRRKHDLTFPDKFHFIYARSALSAGMIQAAMDSANEYLSATGTSGKYYGDTQELLKEGRAKMPMLPEMVVLPGGVFGWAVYPVKSVTAKTR